MKKRKGEGRVRFLLHLDGIKRLREEGYPLISIHDTFKDGLDMTYSQFVKYTQIYLRDEDERKSTRLKEKKYSGSGQRRGTEEKKGDILQPVAKKSVLIDNTSAEENEHFRRLIGEKK